MTCTEGEVPHFNPLHREGGDGSNLSDIEAIIISIHSTARVETEWMPHMMQGLEISIHSTARVETNQPNRNDSLLLYFNPLHREGGDGCREL